MTKVRVLWAQLWAWVAKWATAQAQPGKINYSQRDPAIPIVEIGTVFTTGRPSGKRSNLEWCFAVIKAPTGNQPIPAYEVVQAGPLKTEAAAEPRMDLAYALGFQLDPRPRDHLTPYRMIRADPQTRAYRMVLAELKDLDITPIIFVGAIEAAGLIESQDSAAKTGA